MMFNIFYFFKVLYSFERETEIVTDIGIENTDGGGRRRKLPAEQGPRHWGGSQNPGIICKSPGEKCIL